MKTAGFLLLLFSAAALAPGSAAGAIVARAGDVALLPLENLSAAPEASAKIGAIVQRALEARGWRVVSGNPVESALDAARVRYLDSLPSPVRSTLGASLEVPALALGTVYAYDATADPRVAVGLRILAGDGRILFSDFVAMRAEDGEKIFQSGQAVTREHLAKEAVARLAKRLPRPGGAPVSLRTRGIPVHLASPRTYRSSALAAGTPHRIAILPFANAAPHEAARIVEELFARRLAGSKLFDPVAPADLRAAFVDEKIQSLSDPAELRRLGKRLGTTLFLTGTIYEFAEPVQAGSGTPRLEMEATVTDVATGEIVWTSYAARRGTDYRGLLGLGAITSAVGLADQSAFEMIHAAEKTRPTAGHGLAQSLPKRPADPAQTGKENPR